MPGPLKKGELKGRREEGSDRGRDETANEGSRDGGGLVSSDVTGSPLSLDSLLLFFFFPPHKPFKQ